MGKSNGKSKDETAPAAEPGEIQITLPVGGGERPGFQRELVEAGELSLDVTAVHLNINVGRRGAAAFVRVRNGLIARGAKLEGGRPVFTNADALRFIVEEIANAVNGTA